MKRFLLLLFAALPGCAVSSIPIWGPSCPSSAPSSDVHRITDVAYHEGPDAGPRHRLDLFLPKDKKDFPVVVFVHGGAWMLGDNRCCGLYSAVAECLAKEGIGVVVPNYRLSPRVAHPEHVKDVARAVAWTKSHIEQYGGRSEQLFLVGHSAGGHLVALLATDERYLKGQGLSTDDVKGVVAICGVYEIPPGKVDVRLGGVADNSFRPDQMFPLRGPSPESAIPPGPGIHASIEVYGPAFGNDPAARRDASPLHHVRPGLPPFLLISADNDLPTLPDMAKRFHAALRDQRCEANLLCVARRNHNSTCFSATAPDDPVARAIIDMVKNRKK